MLIVQPLLSYGWASECRMSKITNDCN